MRFQLQVLYRWAFILLAAVMAGYLTYDFMRPIQAPAPVEQRQAYPAPPATLDVYGETFDLGALENPLRLTVLKQMQDDPEAAWQMYADHVADGREIYYQNCFYCHGDLLDGKGHFARGLDPQPTNIQDVETIAQRQEAALFWRITTGVKGLPGEAAPWNSAMPAWEKTLDEDEVWKVIMFLYDYVGQMPQMNDPGMTSAVAAMRDQVRQHRENLEGKALYDFRCAMCHGEQGESDGPAAEYLYPTPADFSMSLFKYRFSELGKMPLDDDLFFVIKFGLPETGMPGFRSVLNDHQIRSLLPVIKRLDIAASWVSDDEENFDDEGHYLGDDFLKIEQREPLNGKVPFSTASVARGRQVFDDNCAQCHGKQGRGNIVSDKRLRDDWGARIWPRDLTKPWTWRATHIPGPPEHVRNTIIDKIYVRVTVGMPGSPMPASRAPGSNERDPISEEDRWNVANYVYTLRETSVPPTRDAVLRAQQVNGALPETVDNSLWQQASPVSLYLVPNIMRGERLFKPHNDAVTVRTLYNEDEIAFLLEVNDRTDSRPGEPVSTHIHDESLAFYSDAMAIQFPNKGAYQMDPIPVKPHFDHGGRQAPVTMWHWNAGSVEPATPAQVMLFDSSGAGNAPQPRPAASDLFATGHWEDGRLQVVMKYPRRGTDKDIDFTEDQFIPVAFANWDGNNGEIGPQHTLTSWHWLVLPRQEGVLRLYGLPLLVFLLVLAGGLVITRRPAAKS